MIPLAAGNSGSASSHSRSQEPPLSFHRNQTSNYSGRENGSRVASGSPLVYNPTHTEKFRYADDHDTQRDSPRSESMRRRRRSSQPPLRVRNAAVQTCPEELNWIDDRTTLNQISEILEGSYEALNSSKQLIHNSSCRSPLACCDERSSNSYLLNGLDDDVNGIYHNCSSCASCVHVVINVSGQIYETQMKTLQRFPETLLGHPEKRKKFYDPEKKHYFFDRNRPSFEAILEFYQSGGRLHRPADVSVDVFAEEIKFFQLGTDAMKEYQEIEGYLFRDEDYVKYGNGMSPAMLEKKKEKLPENKFQRAVWILFEKPDSSNAARLVAVISITVIFASIICFCLETVPSLQVAWKARALASEVSSENAYNETVFSNNDNSTSVQAKRQPSFTQNPFWVAETICICWFSIELAARFLSCPQKVKFCCDILNVIDLIAIVPYFVTTATLATTTTEESAVGKKELSLAFIRVVRLVRVFRIFKLSRHSTGLQILAQTLKSSFRELGLLLFFVVIGVIIFSSAVYFAEIDNPDESKIKFQSIPDAFWWAIVTMTTVGYGDMHPVTVAGKMIGSVCALTGILCLALPVPVIVSNFMYFYQRAVANKKRSKEM